VIKKWNDYIKILEEADTVKTDSTVEQELDKRNVNLTEIKNDVANITNVATKLNASTNIEDIAKELENTINQYNNKTDTYVTLALTYLKTIADKRVIELKLEQYKTRIPELQNELKTKIEELNAEIQKGQEASTSEITT
jgi:uncharacterized protein (DUF1501 family)